MDAQTKNEIIADRTRESLKATVPEDFVGKKRLTKQSNESKVQWFQN